MLLTDCKRCAFESINVKILYLSIMLYVYSVFFFLNLHHVSPINIKAMSKFIKILEFINEIMKVIFPFLKKKF